MGGLIDMPSLQIYSRGESKKYVSNLFNDITERNYVGARNTADNLRNCLLKYYITRGVDCTNIYNTFHEFDFLLRVASGSTKQNTCFDFIKKLCAVGQQTIQDPIDNLRQIYDDLRFAYLHISTESVNTILDCFDEIRSLQPRLQKQSGSAFNYYTYVLKNIGDCEGVLVDVTGAQYQQNKYLDKATIKGLSGNFQKLFSSIQSVFAPSVRLDINSEEVKRLVKQNKSISEIAKASGHREEELQAMLNQIEAADEDDN